MDDAGGIPEWEKENRAGNGRMKQDQIREWKTGQYDSMDCKQYKLTGSRRRIGIIGLVLLLGTGLIGCKVTADQEIEKIRDMDFTVLAEEEIPEEVRRMIEERKETEFKLTFQDGSALYICVGYGQQEQGGYSIAVNDLYETENAIYADTNLIGPDADREELYRDPEKESPSFPYLVLKTEYIHKVVVFD